MGPVTDIGVFLTVGGCLIGVTLIWSLRHPRHFTRRLTVFERWYYGGVSCLLTVIGLCTLFDWERVAQLTLVIAFTIASAAFAVLGPHGAPSALARRYHGAAVRPVEIVIVTLTCECGAICLLSMGLAMFVPLGPIQTLSTTDAAVIWAFLISGIAFVLGAFASVILTVILRVPHAPD